jgi:hypothetical protein
MHARIRFFRDGPPFIAAMARVETGFLRQLTRMPGFLGTTALRWHDGRGLGIVTFKRLNELEAAIAAAEVWGNHHLADLRSAIEPTDLLEAEILFHRGQHL